MSGQPRASNVLSAMKEALLDGNYQHALGLYAGSYCPPLTVLTHGTPISDSALNITSMVYLTLAQSGLFYEQGQVEVARQLFGRARDVALEGFVADVIERDHYEDMFELFDTVEKKVRK